MEERAEQIPRMGDVLRNELSNGVYRRREPYTRHQINELSHFFQHKKQLAQLWEQNWCSMKEHQTSRAEIHRKVIRIVTPMSDLEAKLMLRQIGE